MALGTTHCGSSSSSTITPPPPPTAPSLVYVANHGSGDVSAFTADSATGALTPISGSPFTVGAGLSAIAVNASGTLAYATGYDSSSAGSLYGFTVAPSSGVLSPIAGFPVSVDTDPLSLTFDPTGGYLFVASWSGRLIYVFNVDTTSGALIPVTNSPFFAGGSPRILAMHPTGKFLFAADDGTDTILAYSISAGALTQIGGSAFSDLNRPWGIAVTPDGNYLYIADEAGTYTVEGFSIGANGSLTALANSPFTTAGVALSVTVAPSGAYAYAADFAGNNVSGLTIDASTGNLTQMGSSPFLTGTGQTNPSAVAVNATSKFAYVTNYATNNLAAFSIDSSGTLTEFTTSPYSVGTGPVAVATAVGKP